ncbi:MAG: hypothetical protein IIC73_05790 [Armatimonadetes bacterium]|nr:hypothetical protein [Armatimonadota bacterium]
MMKMQRSGRVSPVLIVAVAFVVGLIVMALTVGESPTSVVARFMAALAEGDAETLTDLSYLEDVSREEMLAKWEYTTGVVAPYFSFDYEIKGVSRPSDDQAIVWMMYTVNAGMRGSFDERFELELHSTDDGWKINVFAMSRQMFPGLPR